ncbi:hypothetical protein BS47DRAFT_831561 [Hydnum rufescens UP504]|uniref:Uncharacterized protein n=1 Tax=Hydnum rufescens UP504 TaxID=1448309 RepID=A0A9P6DF13_9AGAM|nr:hypothetical protein BS47DRAFT_831561 [Hydnum rufescens UP504]
MSVYPFTRQPVACSPFPVGFSSMLRTCPSLRIFFSCGPVTIGFFIGVLIDSPFSSYFHKPDTKSRSLIGVIFGLVSSISIVPHAVVFLDAVGRSTFQLPSNPNLADLDPARGWRLCWLVCCQTTTVQR